MPVTSDVESASVREEQHPATTGVANTAAVQEQGAQIPEKALPSQKSTLNAEDIRSLFSGAPQFSVVDRDGLPWPKAEFPWDYGLAVRDVSDCLPIEHPAYSSVTLRPHLPSPGNPSGHDAGVVGYNIGVFETPSMLSAQGKEPGTVGFDYFLQESIADALEPRPDSGGSAENVFNSFSNYELLQTNPEKLGIRRFDRIVIAERLAELCDFYRGYRESSTKANILTKQTTAELYTILFAKMLTPPRFDSSTADPTGLKVQIEALTRVLKIQQVWYNFSDEEWRIRLGQVLLSENTDTEHPDAGNGLTDRDLLLLQLVLSCELLIRLDAIAGMSAEVVNNSLHLTNSEVGNFRFLETRKTRWDLVLARRVLESVQIKSEITSIPQYFGDEYGDGLRETNNEPELNQNAFQPKVNIIFLPRRLGQQLSGLLNFSRNVNWPEVDQFEETLIDKFQMGEEVLTLPSPSIYATPLSTPRSNRSSGYFSSRPSAQKTFSQESIHLQTPLPVNRSSRLEDATLNPTSTASIGGWLSRSYLTGLILPGETLSHLLISALLENDTRAITSLGDSANLYGGFVYQFRSWWSKRCIVGKVLACLKGTAECMGWLSCPTTPQGFPDGWLAIDAGDPPSTGGEPRIQHPEKVGQDADFLAATPAGQETKATELILPRDSATAPSSQIWFEGLRLQARETPFRPSASESDFEDPGQSTYTAALHFSASTMSVELGHPVIPLRYNVQFVTTFPCTPPAPDKLVILNADSSEAAGTASEVPVHPLHVSHTFEIRPATRLLSSPEAAPSWSGERSGNDESSPILILDARGDSVLELIARAWCASVGHHAVVGRVGDTCIACSVREARALGIAVVIRVA